MKGRVKSPLLLSCYRGNEETQASRDTASDPG